MIARKKNEQYDPAEERLALPRCELEIELIDAEA
jgi:hypothetical protein